MGESQLRPPSRNIANINTQRTENSPRPVPKPVSKRPPARGKKAKEDKEMEGGFGGKNSLTKIKPPEPTKLFFIRTDELSPYKKFEKKFA